MRKLIKEADTDVVEEWKWIKATKPGTPERRNAKRDT